MKLLLGKNSRNHSFIFSVKKNLKSVKNCSKHRVFKNSAVGPSCEQISGHHADGIKLARTFTIDWDLVPVGFKLLFNFLLLFRSKFGFTFIICARENKVAAILEGLALR